MTTSVRIPEETQRRLDALAERTHRSRSFYLREAIERGLATRLAVDEEAAFMAQLARS